MASPSVQHPSHSLLRRKSVAAMLASSRGEDDHARTTAR
jgi:hypothetical protein